MGEAAGGAGAWVWSIAIAGASAAVAWLGTGALLRVLRRHAVLDHPNPRSSHTRPTPRGGGLAVVALETGNAEAAELEDLGIKGLPELAVEIRDDVVDLGCEAREAFLQVGGEESRLSGSRSHTGTVRTQTGRVNARARPVRARPVG